MNCSWVLYVRFSRCYIYYPIMDSTTTLCWLVRAIQLKSTCPSSPPKPIKPLRHRARLSPMQRFLKSIYFLTSLTPKPNDHLSLFLCPKPSMLRWSCPRSACFCSLAAHTRASKQKRFPRNYRRNFPSRFPLFVPDFPALSYAPILSAPKCRSVSFIFFSLTGWD